MGKGKKPERKVNLKGFHSDKGGKALDRAKKREFAEAKRHRNKKQWQSDWDKFEAQAAGLGLMIRDIKGDGNCMFRAVADQLYGNQHRHDEIRQTACDFMEANPDDFAPFVEDDVGLDSHLRDMRKDSVWGGHMELQAISRSLSINLVVHQLGSQPWEIRNHSPGTRTIHMSYHDGEHYSSVRLADDDTWEAARPINFSELRTSKAAAFAALAEGPSVEERLIMTSTLVSDLTKIRRTLTMCGGDTETAIEMLIALRGQEDEEEEEAASAVTPAVAAPAPAPSPPVPSVCVSAPAPPPPPLAVWACEVCSYNNLECDAACDMCSCARPAAAPLFFPSSAPPPTPPVAAPSTAPVTATAAASSATTAAVTAPTAPSGDKAELKPNDFCPCGSKLRYRKCCAKRKKTAARLAGAVDSHLSNKARKEAMRAERVAGRGGEKEKGKEGDGEKDGESTDEETRALIQTLLI